MTHYHELAENFLATVKLAAVHFWQRNCEFTAGKSWVLISDASWVTRLLDKNAQSDQIRFGSPFKGREVGDVLLKTRGIMTPNEVLDEVSAIMSDVFDVDLEPGSVTLDTTAKDIDEWDSLSHIRLIVAIERKFDVKFKNSEIESLKRVGDLVALIQAKVAA